MTTSRKNRTDTILPHIPADVRAIMAALVNTPPPAVGDRSTRKLPPTPRKQHARLRAATARLDHLQRQLEAKPFNSAEHAAYRAALREHQRELREHTLTLRKVRMATRRRKRPDLS